MSGEIVTANVRPGVKFPVHLKDEYEQIRYLPSNALQPLLERAQKFDLWRSNISELTGVAVILEIIAAAVTRSDPKIPIGGSVVWALMTGYLWTKGARVKMIQNEIASRPSVENTSPDLI